MKKNKLIVKKISDTMYGQDVTLLVGHREDILKHISDKEHCQLKPDTLQYTDGCYLSPDRIDQPHYICVKTFEGYSRDFALMGHEIFHMTRFVLDGLGMHLTADSEEAYAYYFQNIFYKVVMVLNDLRRNN